MDPLTVADWTVSPAADESRWFPVEEASAAAGVRRGITLFAQRLGFTGERLGQVQLAATEAATNLAKHAVRGEMLVRVVRNGPTAALEIVSVDHGPGIADVSRSRLGGYSTSGTLGLGLGSIERLADRSGLHSLPRIGTTLYARFRQPADGPAAAPSRPDPPFAGVTRPIAGETECGDAYAALETRDGAVYAMLCDGLGHGPLAARAAHEAVEVMRETALPARPAEILERIHRRLRPTRGGAVAVALIVPERGRVRYAGVGNISGWIVHPDRRTGMISVPGIAGSHARVREQVYDLPPGAAVVLHSDGLTDRWDPAARPGLFDREPLLIAATLLRDAGSRHDDRSVLAVTSAGRG
ncbi:ATP-binding SpoIIE family protein phosphatase [Actinomadura sp. 7K534]|uniref:ATP-binding SpoIIE family protein phosphatase n=1 Tax=Actinomadura sp. 7K534 TaxID=2530366 RepID=UPI0010507254|nr:ATP-binding SpoIIE family protein phosphatase [Actinomadura sp. 7K534]TDB90289.1 transcriptional regulator [Actinomadura sp. 7K534]